MCGFNSDRVQTKELATRYERSLQDSEAALEKCKTRFDITGEELQRFLISKEGESAKDAGMAGNRSGTNTGGKRAIGKAVAKGGMLLKGKNPANVRETATFSYYLRIHLIFTCLFFLISFIDKRRISAPGCHQLQIHTGKPYWRLKLYGKNISIFSYLGYCGYVSHINFPRLWPHPLLSEHRLSKNVQTRLILAFNITCRDMHSFSNLLF